jgi:Flp pilus assembly protein TadG
MGLIRRLFACRKGTAGIEAALVLPILISMILGLVEMTRYIEASRKAMSAAQTVADLVAQDASHTTTSINEVRVAASLIMAPLTTTDGSFNLTISSVGFDSNGDPELLWQDPYAGVATVDPAQATGLGDPNESVIAVNLTYTYQSPFDFFIDQRTLSESAYARPRITRRVALNGQTDHDP